MLHVWLEFLKSVGDMMWEKLGDFMLYQLLCLIVGNVAVLTGLGLAHIWMRWE